MFPTLRFYVIVLSIKLQAVAAKNGLEGIVSLSLNNGRTLASDDVVRPPWQQQWFSNK